MFFVLLSLLCMLFLLFVMRFQLGTSPPRGTVGCATFLFRVGFRLPSPQPRHAAVRGRVFTAVCLIIAPAFSFNCFSSRFSWLHNLTVQRCGSGF